MSWGWGRLWKGRLRSSAYSTPTTHQLKNPNSLSSSSHTSQPAPGMRPAGPNKEKTRPTWESWSQRSPQPQTHGSTRSRGETPEACCGQGLPGQPRQVHTEGTNPCHPARDWERLSRTKTQVGGPRSTLGSRWAHANFLGQCLTMGQEFSS